MQKESLMVSESYWERLSNKEREEFRKISRDLPYIAQSAGVRDGYEFSMKYSVGFDGEEYFIERDGDGVALANLRSSSKKVMETLIAEICQNYGR